MATEENDTLFAEFSFFLDTPTNIHQDLPNPEEPRNPDDVPPPSHELDSFSDYAAQTDLDLITVEDYFPDVEGEQCGSGLEQNPSLSFPFGSDALVEPPQAYQSPAMSSPENMFFSGEMGQASSTEYHFSAVQGEQCPSGIEPCSDELVKLPENGHFTGGLQNYGSVKMPVSNPLAKLKFLKVEKYTPEERKKRVSKHIAKRALRNFHNIIKYPIRKAIADSRPRLGGMFVPKAFYNDDL